MKNDRKTPARAAFLLGNISAAAALLVSMQASAGILTGQAPAALIAASAVTPIAPAAPAAQATARLPLAVVKAQPAAPLAPAAPVVSAAPASVEKASIQSSAKALANDGQTGNASIAQLWDKLETKRLAPMRAFAQAQFPKEHAQCKTLFYPFGGPDALNAVTFFPNCQRYVLFGLEPVGSLPDTSKLSPQQLTQVQAVMAKAQDYLIRRNFFVTQYMSRDLHSSQLNGILPLVSVMLVRTGCVLESIEPLEITGDPFVATGKGKVSPRGVRVSLKNANGMSQSLEYYNFDASDAGLVAKPDFLQRLQALESDGQVVTLLKAASYLMHAGEFAKMREQVLKRSALIVQDDAGVPYKALKDAGFKVELHGHYAKPIEVFNYRFQRDLLKDYTAGEPRADLPFEWSYNASPTQMGLQIARKP